MLLLYMHIDFSVYDITEPFMIKNMKPKDRVLLVVGNYSMGCVLID